MSHFYLLLLILVLSIAAIVFLTARLRINAFFVLLLTALSVGLAAGLPAPAVITALKSGFGHLLEAIGLIVIEGTVLGIILEKTGATVRLAEFILARSGEKRAPLAIALTGFIVGLPIFCDSGFVVLSGLNRSLARRTGVPMAVMAVSLATGLYAVHCLVPPHPGVSAVAGLIGADAGRLLLTGTLVAIPGAWVGYAWARWRGSTETATTSDEAVLTHTPTPADLPPVLPAFLPIAVPVLLIGLKAGLGSTLSGANGLVLQPQLRRGSIAFLVMTELGSSLVSSSPVGPVRHVLPYRHFQQQ